MTLDVKNLGQVFTPDDIVNRMIELIKNKGSILEPSCGNGAFSSQLENCVSIEIDERVCPTYAHNINFFQYPDENKFDTIIGNPPYVRFRDICEKTKSLLDMSLFNERTNLYMFFIYKAIKHLKDNGELIFITPREFLKATSSIELNNFIYENGTITDLINFGDKIIFKDYNPNVIIFRYEKGNFSRVTNGCKRFCNINGQLLFLTKEYSVPFSDLFYVKVGGVSGADRIFTNENGNMDFVNSKTISTGETKKMFYDIKAKELLTYKDELFNRRIKKFTEENWYKWGRGFYISNEPRIYVNMKTRISEPFFTHPCKNYDGSILAVFPKFKDNLHEVIEMLNKVDWKELGFVCNGRFIFTQKSLENCILPKEFSKFLQ